jgi:Spy/CpxP family protein refolding chaperone
MLFPTVVLGTLGGIVGARLMLRRRFGGGCAHHRHRHGGFRFYRALRALGLDRAQKRELWSIARELREAGSSMRFAGMEGLDTLADAVTADAFDRAGVEAAAEAHGRALGQLREKVMRAAERVHALLTPEQRRRLRELLGAAIPRNEESGGPEGGPYRSVVTPS